MEKNEKKVEAFILVETRAGTAVDVTSRLKKTTGVKAIYVVTGPYDIVVHAVADDLKTLASTVVDRIGATEGIERTLTCIVVGNSSAG